MKKVVVLFVSIFLALNVMGANEKYYQKMGEALAKFGASKTIEEYQEVANQFRTISNMETNEWLPLYYEAHCYILMSFIEYSSSDARDTWLDQAEKPIKKMQEIAPGESEVFALKAFYHTGRLVINPPQRSQMTAPLVASAIGTSLSLDADNPRAKIMRLSNAIGTARFFGSDITEYCEDARELLEDWDSYPVRSAIHPSWGRDQVQEIVNNCRK